MVFELEAFAEDCARAAVVTSTRDAISADCAATLVDRSVWRAGGAVALRWSADRFEQTVTLPPGYNRPWGHGSENARIDILPMASSHVKDEAAPQPQNLDADD
jgi:hypothetical protein